LKAKRRQVDKETGKEQEIDDDSIIVLDEEGNEVSQSSIESGECVDETAKETLTDTTEPNGSDEHQSPMKRKREEEQSLLGMSLTEIPGTPILNSLSGVKQVPDREKFSIGIEAHKPYEMHTDATGSYQNIVELTRKFKKQHTL
jgi:hypothetical protein